LKREKIRAQRNNRRKGFRTELSGGIRDEESELS